jgi:epoxyqueuosine reductase
MFPKSGVKRTGRARFLRNVLIAIGNSGDVTLVPDARQLLDDPSPLIRGAAVWALSQLLPREEFVALRCADADAMVDEEWQAAIESGLN